MYVCSPPPPYTLVLRNSGKHQQVVSGVSLNAYWTSSFLWDFVSLLLPVGITLIILAAADVEALIKGEAGGATVLLFVLYGLSMVRCLQSCPIVPVVVVGVVFSCVIFHCYRSCRCFFCRCCCSLCEVIPMSWLFTATIRRRHMDDIRTETVSTSQHEVCGYLL